MPAACEHASSSRSEGSSDPEQVALQQAWFKAVAVSPVVWVRLFAGELPCPHAATPLPSTSNNNCN